MCSTSVATDGWIFVGIWRHVLEDLEGALHFHGHYYQQKGKLRLIRIIFFLLLNNYFNNKDEAISDIFIVIQFKFIQFRNEIIIVITYGYIKCNNKIIKHYN